MYRVTHKSANGAFWDGEKAVREITVKDPDRARKLEQEGHTVEEISPRVDFSTMKVEELRQYAADRKIDLAGAKTKAQIIDILNKA